MINLLLKDYRIQKYSLIIYFFILILALRTDYETPVAVILVGVVFVVNAISYDNKNKVTLFLVALPYTRNQLITSKYIGSILIVIPILVAAVAYKLIFEKGIAITMLEVILCFVGVLLFVAFYLPIAYKWGQQYVLIVSFVLILGVLYLGRPIYKYIAPKLSFLNDLSQYQLYTMGAGVTVILCALSWLLTLKIFNNKQL